LLRVGQHVGSFGLGRPHYLVGLRPGRGLGLLDAALCVVLKLRNFG
jgi:hypothetical protein